MNFDNKNSHFIGIESKTFLISLIILAVNLGVRGWFNVHTAISRDEPYTLYFAQLPLRQLLAIVLESNNPPTFEVLLHFWAQLVGNTERALRWLPTIIISLGAIPFSLIGKRIGGYPAMWLSAILFLGSGALMNFSHLDRAYCLLITGAIFQTYFLIKQYESPSWKNSVGWAICSTILCYSHYFGWCMPVINWLMIISIPVRRSTIVRQMWLPSIIVLILTSPIILVLINQLRTAAKDNSIEYSTPNIQHILRIGREFLNSTHVLSLILAACVILGIMLLRSAMKKAGLGIFLFGALLLSANFLASEQHQQMSSLLYFVLFLIVVMICFNAIRKSEILLPEKIILYWALLPIITFFLASAVVPVFIDRYLNFALPPIILAVVILLNKITSKTLRGTFTVCILFPYFYGFRLTPDYNVDNREAIEQFKDYHKRAEISIIGPGYHDLDFAYYFNRSLFYNGAAHQGDTAGVKLIGDKGFARHKEGLRRELLKNHIIVSHDSSDLNLKHATSVAYYDGNTSLSYPENGIYPYLLARYGEPIEAKSFDGVYNVYLFRKNDIPENRP